MRRVSDFMSKVISYLPGRSGEFDHDYKTHARAARKSTSTGVSSTSGSTGVTGAGAGGAGSSYFVTETYRGSRRESYEPGSYEGSYGGRAGVGLRSGSRSGSNPGSKSSSRSSSVGRPAGSASRSGGTTLPRIDSNRNNQVSVAAQKDALVLNSRGSTRESAILNSRGGGIASRSQRVKELFSGSGGLSSSAKDSESSVLTSRGVKLANVAGAKSSSGAAASSSSSSSSGVKALCCDKCDGKHETLNCPYYKKGRESHPDAQKNFYKKLGGSSVLPGALLRNARVVRQPGDGSCLFHSMSYGLKDGSRAGSLRTEICSFIQKNPDFPICETPLSDWVNWDSRESCGSYARRMSRGGWGGGIEMACVAQIKGVNVHVYERCSSGYKRISAFDHSSSPERRHTVRVLYCGGVHYDALVA